MKNEQEFIKDFKKLLDKYNYFIEYDWDEGYRIGSDNKEDREKYDFLTLARLDTDDIKNLLSDNNCSKCGKQIVFNEFRLGVKCPECGKQFCKECLGDDFECPTCSNKNLVE